MITFWTRKTLVALFSGIDHNIRCAIALFVCRVPDGVISFRTLKILQTLLGGINNHVRLTFADLSLGVELRS